MQLDQLLKQLKLPRFIDNYSQLAISCEQSKTSFIEYLEQLVKLELESRAKNKVQKLLYQANLCSNKTLADFDVAEVPGLARSKLTQLASADFMLEAQNLLIFGATGTGKTHLSCALARQWCLYGKRVLYVKAQALVADLVRAQNESYLNQAKQRLQRNDAIIIDDLLYHQYTQTEMALLLTLIAEAYETKSLVITAHLPLAQWKSVFYDEVSALAAIDRLIHYSVIIELNTESYRLKQANKRAEANDVAEANLNQDSDLAKTLTE